MAKLCGYGLPDIAIMEGGIPVQPGEFVPNYMIHQGRGPNTLMSWGPWTMSGILHPELAEWLQNYCQDQGLPELPDYMRRTLQSILLAFQATCIGCDSSKMRPLTGAEVALMSFVQGEFKSVTPAYTEGFWPPEVVDKALEKRKALSTKWVEAMAVIKRLLDSE